MCATERAGRRTLQRERAANEARLRQPINAATLSRNQFLNALFARKSFSWTAVLMDLEDVLPAGVQVSSIEPLHLDSTGEVTIRLRVLGDRERTVQLVRNLEGSRRFLSPRLAGRGTADSRPQQREANPGRERPAAAGEYRDGTERPSADLRRRV